MTPTLLFWYVVAVCGGISVGGVFAFVAYFVIIFLRGWMARLALPPNNTA